LGKKDLISRDRPGQKIINPALVYSFETVH